MRSRALIGLLARPSLIVTLGLIATLTAAIMWMRHFIEDSSTGRGLFFTVMFNALAYVLLVSLGGFLGKVTSELETIRLARVVPGLRRWVNTNVVLLVPVVASLALLFLKITLPEQFKEIHPGTQWFLNAFLFSLGLGLGSSPWFLHLILGTILIELGFFLEHLRNDPGVSSLIALGGALLLLALRHRMFLAPFSGEDGITFRLRQLWLDMPFAEVSGGRRNLASRCEAHGWIGAFGNVTLPKLVKAGIYERLGHKRGKDWGRVTTSVAMVHLIFGIILYAGSKQSPVLGFGGFVTQVFTAEKPDQTTNAMRYLFAAIVASVAYVAAVTHDSSLRATLWHPISRHLRFRAVFLSHVRQNLIYCSAHLLVGSVLIAGLAHHAAVAISFSAVNAFLLPALVVFVLAPVPQAMFPNGADDFHGKINPLRQLLAGILGGLFCLLTIYWTTYWPTKELHVGLSALARLVLALSGVIAVYAGYYVRMRTYYLHADLISRSV